ncbi:GNAT family N-acetyltransferase [Streptomyces eurythermus]|uniref:GNAT family N-acetyltransferase n=1 Tax=Streptomyces eurythermus TaxID=42237 RepID=UPI0036C84BC9
MAELANEEMRGHRIPLPRPRGRSRRLGRTRPVRRSPFLVAAQTELTGGRPDFEHYLDTLRSSRDKIRRERKQFAEAGVHTRVLYGTGEPNEDSARLQLAPRERYGAADSIESILRDYAHPGATVDDRVRVLLCERQGRPIGMSLVLVDGDRPHVRLAAASTTPRPDAGFAYFDVVYYEPTLWGIDHGPTGRCGRGAWNFPHVDRRGATVGWVSVPEAGMRRIPPVGGAGTGAAHRPGRVRRRHRASPGPPPAPTPLTPAA